MIGSGQISDAIRCGEEEPCGLRGSSVLASIVRRVRSLKRLDFGCSEGLRWKPSRRQGQPVRSGWQVSLRHGFPNYPPLYYPPKVPP